MKRTALLITIALGIAAASSVGALGASSSSGKRFVIAGVFHLTNPSAEPPTAAAGTFSIAGAFSDRGTEAQNFSATIGPGSMSIVGTETFTGAAGTISDKFTFVAFPPAAPRSVFTGRAVITNGTGAYRSLTGKKLNVVGVIDTTTNQVTETADSKVGK